MESVGEPQNACRVCQHALKIDPGNGKAQFQYVICFRFSISFHILFFSSYGKALIALGDYHEAKRRLLIAQAKCPADENISLQLVKVRK
jgi:hypothetical protein